MLGVHSRCGLHTRAVTVFRDPLSEGFRHFVASMPAPVASGWSESPGGPRTHWKAPPCHGAPPSWSFPLISRLQPPVGYGRITDRSAFTSTAYAKATNAG